jgi:hypothetical protein
MRIVRHAGLVAAFALLGCASHPIVSVEQPLSDDKRVLLVLVGGNNEARSPGGIMNLYGGRDGYPSSYLAAMFKRQGIEPGSVQPYYFSWTGDDEDDRRLLPSHWSWITGGDERIAQALGKPLSSLTAAQQLVVIGWSNGGATAYDFACGLSLTRPVDLLITLDPVSRTTQPCPGLVANLWLNSYTESGPGNRFKTGNIIAFFGGAWNKHLPSQATASKKLEGANHGDTQSMMNKRIEQEEAFKAWASNVPK